MREVDEPEWELENKWGRGVLTMEHVAFRKGRVSHLVNGVKII